MPATWHNLFHTIDGLVAVGTIGLAAVTLIVVAFAWRTASATSKLANETRSLVDATTDLARVSAEEVELSRRAMQAEVKPLLADWPADNRRVKFERASSSAHISVPAVNSGAVALIQSVTMHWDELGAPTPAIRQGTCTVLAVGAGGETEAHFDFVDGELHRVDGVDELGKFWVEIAYTDATGGQPEVTRFDIWRKSEAGSTRPQWLVWAVSFRRAGEAEPYAESRPANR